MTNRPYAKSNGDGLLCSILCPGVTASVYGTCAKNNGDGLLYSIL